MADDVKTLKPTDDWERDVWLMARRAALLYYYMGKTIIDHAGEEKGKELIKKAVWDYGVHCGKAVAEGVKAMGLPLEVGNFRKVPDLPSRGWRANMVTKPDGSPQSQNVHCPLASVWKELGEEELGRIYCFVDQAKTEGYNPELECLHAHNVLDGDPFCEIIMRPREKK